MFSVSSVVKFCLIFVITVESNVDAIALRKSRENLLLRLQLSILLYCVYQQITIE